MRVGTVVAAGAVIIGALMSILDATVVNVASSTLGRKLHSRLSTIHWVISGYTLALGSVIPVSGWAADLGRYPAHKQSPDPDESDRATAW